MNSTISNDINREHLVFETAQCLKNIHVNTKNVTALHKELLEINLSVTAYIEESKNRLKALRLELANQANSSQKVVEILSDKCKSNKKMSPLPKTPQKRKSHSRNIHISIAEANNNAKSQISKEQSAKNFITWYKSKIDNDRQNLSSYLSDEVTLEWFGRTIKTRKKVSSFVKNDIQCSRHDFTSVESIDRIQTRHEKSQRTSDASPLKTPEVEISKTHKTTKRKINSTCLSPQWAEGCGLEEESEPIEKKKRIQDNIKNKYIELKSNTENEIGNKGDGIDKSKSKHSSVTPPNMECGQGDCLPSTSGTNPDTSSDALTTQLPKLAVECNGYIEFTRTRNNRGTDSMKWDRKCKVQISYSEDPLNVGEYVIWGLRYSDENKCRRNLMAAFEEVASD